MQPSELVAPADDDLPAAQEEQLALPSVEYLPTAQVAQLAGGAVAFGAVPAGHTA